MNKRKTPKYNPMSKEFQEEAERLGLTGNQLIQKYAAYLREWRHSNGILSMEENTDCANYLGIIVAERQYGRIILPEMLRGIEQEMPYGNPYYDFLMTGNIKVDIKSCCLKNLKGWSGWEPHIRFNNVTDYFVILVFDDRENLHLVHIWMIGKNEIIRGEKFYNRGSIKITNKYRYLLPFKRFDWIDKLECLKNTK